MTLFLLLMPLVLVLLGIAYAVSIRLRSSGLVFGGESFAWTMASRIGVKRRANDNSLLRLIFITPEAWRRQEIAHCYYYKSDRVIQDMASYMADWSRHAPSRFLSVGAWTADAARWAVVLLFVLSIFAVSVPFASLFAKVGSLQAAPPQQVPAPDAELVETQTRICQQTRTVAIEVAATASEADVKAAAWRKLQDDGVVKPGGEWSELSIGSSMCDTVLNRRTCTLWLQLCRPRPIECKDTPDVVEAAFEVSGLPDEQIKSDITSSVLSTLIGRWRSEVASKFGSEWADFSFNFSTLRDRRPAESSCREEASSAGGLRFHCRVAAAACKMPPAQRSGR